MTEKQKAILKAIEAVKDGVSISAAARQYNIPRSTLDDKIRGRYSLECSKGPATVLSKSEEDHLKNWIMFMADSGFPVSKAQLLDSVSLLVRRIKRDNPFRNCRPGRHWFEGFIKRHPEVGQRVAQNLTQTRALVNESNLRTWFREVEEYFSTAQLEVAAQDPRRVFNCDESAFFLSPTDNRVLAKRGSKTVYNIIPSSEKECVTVLVTANAAGELAPPMVLFKLKSIPHKISKTAPKNWGLGYTPKGWMTGESFYEYMTNVFVPWIEKSDIEFPIIFFLDGHCSHTTLPLSNFCREKKIQMVALYPNATHLLQPMDVAVFRPLKMIWKKAVYNWRNDNQFVKLRKENFCPLLDKALKELDPNSIKNGFRKCGLSPFDANSVDYTKCVTSHPKKPSNTDNVNKIPSDTVDHFKYLESQISPEHLEAFYKNKSPTWKGDKSLEGLFNIWRQMYSKIEMPLDKFNDRSTNPTPPVVQETSDANQSLSLDIGNFTGLTDILDSNFLNSYQFSDFTENEIHKENTGKVEMYEVLDGTLTKITDIEIPSNGYSITNLCKEKKNDPDMETQDQVYFSGEVIRATESQPKYVTPLKKNTGIEIHSNKNVLPKLIKEKISGPERETQVPLYLPGEVMRTIGSQPIYLTPLKKITTNIGTTKNLPKPKTPSTPVETETMKLPLVFYTDSIAKLSQTQTQSFSALTQTSIFNQTPVSAKKIKMTNLMTDDTDTDYVQSKYENIDTPQSTNEIRAAFDNDSHEQPKKYYGHLVVPTPFKDALFWPEAPGSSSKNKIKVPSVITSDRWQIFAQRKIDARIEKEKNRSKAKEKRNIKKTALGGGNKKSKKKLLDTGARDITIDDWFCRLCQRSTKLDMIQCVHYKTWYHTICAEVSPNEITFRCIYCNVSFDE